MKHPTKQKPEPKEEGAEKRSISGPPELFEAADAIMETRMIDTFSEYVRSLIRKDVNQAKEKQPA